MVLEATRQRPHARRRQGGADGVSGIAGEGIAVVDERDRSIAVDLLPIGRFYTKGYRHLVGSRLAGFRGTLPIWSNAG